MKTKEYPKQLFVQKHEEDNEEDNFFIASEDISEVEDDGVVAIYELKELGTRKTDIVYNKK